MVKIGRSGFGFARCFWRCRKKPAARKAIPKNLILCSILSNSMNSQAAQILSSRIAGGILYSGLAIFIQRNGFEPVRLHVGYPSKGLVVHGAMPFVLVAVLFLRKSNATTAHQSRLLAQCCPSIIIPVDDFSSSISIYTRPFNGFEVVIRVMYNCSIFNTPETEVKLDTILALVTSTVYFLLYPIS